MISLWLECAQASAAAYEIDQAKRATELPPGWTEKAYLQGRNDARALVLGNDAGQTMVAFQGTQFSKGEIESIFANVKVFGYSLGMGRRVVGGYWDQLQCLMPMLDEITFKQEDIITGHSLGGSVCEAYGYQIAPYVESLKLNVISIAAPKIGNQAFWDATTFRPTRIIREDDFAPIWPVLPPGWKQPPNGLEWLHNGTWEHIDHRPIAPDSVEAHNIDLYISDLKALSAKGT